MPFALIPTTLGVCFCLVWAFIGGMVLHDSHLAKQQELDQQVGILPLAMSRASSRASAPAPSGPTRNQVARAAS